MEIILSKSEVLDSTSIRNVFLKLKKEDSIFYKSKQYVSFSFRDTIRIDSLESGDYELSYKTILGEEVVKKLRLKENKIQKEHIIFDSISTEKFYSIIPINNIKENESYKVEMSGGCIASIYGKYEIRRKGGSYYFQTINRSKRILEPIELEAVKKFEAELFAIENKNVCLSTGRMTYKITNNKIKEITDNTCNWNGYSNMMHKLNINEFKTSSF